LNPEVATWVHNLTQTYLKQHRYAQAELIYQPAMEIWERALMPDDPKIGGTLKEYAQLLGERSAGLKRKPWWARDSGPKPTWASFAPHFEYEAA